MANGRLRTRWSAASGPRRRGAATKRRSVVTVRDLSFDCVCVVCFVVYFLSLFVIRVFYNVGGGIREKTRESEKPKPKRAGDETARRIPQPGATRDVGGWRLRDATSAQVNTHMIPLPNCEWSRPPASVIWPLPKPGNSMDPSHPSNASADMNVGMYSAQPWAACGVPVDAYAPPPRAADGEFWTDSDGPAAEGRIL